MRDYAAMRDGAITTRRNVGCGKTNAALFDRKIRGHVSCHLVGVLDVLFSRICGEVNSVRVKAMSTPGRFKSTLRNEFAS